ncbi:MAG TPA: hypothetical protein VIK74_09510 [Parasegetibacter sp.]
MLGKSSQIARLIAKYPKGTIENQEEIVLTQWRNESRENEAKFQQLINDDYLLDKIENWLPQRQQLFAEIKSRINAESHQSADSVCRFRMLNYII